MSDVFWGAWSDFTQEWQAINGLVFSSPSKNVALAQLKYLKEAQKTVSSSDDTFTQMVMDTRDWGLQVRSFDEWAKSEAVE